MQVSAFYFSIRLNYYKFRTESSRFLHTFYTFLWYPMAELQSMQHLAKVRYLAIGGVPAAGDGG